MSDDRPAKKATAAVWRSAAHYAPLIHADRRSFAWEWLRRHPPYRTAWQTQSLPPSVFGLIAYVDPDKMVPHARPIWMPELDGRVLDSRPSAKHGACRDRLDIRDLARYVSIEVDASGTEHWLLSDGHWLVRLDISSGTLLGGPVLLEYRLTGLEAAAQQAHTLRQLIALAKNGAMPRALCPREVRALRWIMELRTADAKADGASHLDVARCFFGHAIEDEKRRFESSSYRIRVQRLVRKARQYLDDPFSGPWFQDPR